MGDVGGEGVVTVCVCDCASAGFVDAALEALGHAVWENADGAWLGGGPEGGWNCEGTAVAGVNPDALKELSSASASEALTPPNASSNEIPETPIDPVLVLGLVNGGGKTAAAAAVVAAGCEDDWLGRLNASSNEKIGRAHV